MKIQCDVCNKDEASLFCSADEAALCSACDHRVHHANKLAGKHQRFSLLPPSPNNLPICDICQEKRAFLFCQQDRAILCRECDISIHKANEHTKSHHRFLLTGVKLSPTSNLYSPAPSSSSAASVTDVVPSDKPLSQQTCTANTSTISRENDKLGFKSSNNNELMNGGGVNYGSTSSISEYLMDTLPGWHVEDFLDASSTPFGVYKSGENDVLPFWDGELEGNNLGSISSESMGLWVPQAPPPLFQNSQSYPIMASSGMINFKDSKESVNKKVIKSSRKWRDDGGFTVPQISPSSITSKRTRTLY